jgi:hypothetical protein
MAHLEVINVILQVDSGGNVSKLYPSTTPDSDRGGAFIWCFENQVGRKIDVSVDNFDGYVEINTPLPLTIKRAQRGVIVGTVIKALQGVNKKVTYSLYVDGKFLDPDIIIDGDGGIDPDKSKKSKDKDRPKGGGKKKAGKKR